LHVIISLRNVCNHACLITSTALLFRAIRSDEKLQAETSVSFLKILKFYNSWANDFMVVTRIPCI